SRRRIRDTGPADELLHAPGGGSHRESPAVVARPRAVRPRQAREHAARRREASRPVPDAPGAAGAADGCRRRARVPVRSQATVLAGPLRPFEAAVLLDRAVEVLRDADVVHSQVAVPYGSLFSRLRLPWRE